MPVFNLQKHCLDFTQDFSALHALFNILDKVQVSNSPILAAALALNFRTAFGSPSVWVNTINKVHVCQCWVNILHHCVSGTGLFMIKSQRRVGFEAMKVISAS